MGFGHSPIATISILNVKGESITSDSTEGFLHSFLNVFGSIFNFEELIEIIENEETDLQSYSSPEYFFKEVSLLSLLNPKIRFSVSIGDCAFYSLGLEIKNGVVKSTVTDFGEDEEKEDSSYNWKSLNNVDCWHDSPTAVKTIFRNVKKENMELVKGLK